MLARSNLESRIKSYKRKENFPVIKSNYRISARSATVICAARLKQRFIDNAITL